MKKPQVMGRFLFRLLAERRTLAQRVTPEIGRYADFTKYKTFAIRNGESNSRKPARSGDLVGKRVEGGVVRDLTARGLTKSSLRTDWNFVYRFESHGRRNLRRNPAKWYGLSTRAVRVLFA